MQIRSSAFDNNGILPGKYTCDGQGLSPPVVWSEIPSDTKSLVLIVDDPDAPDPAAPRRTWVHWVVYDIPPAMSGLAEGAADHLPSGIRAGMNDSHNTDYSGPCPPMGRHRYFFKLYALDKTLGKLVSDNKAGLEKAMQGHVLTKSELVGLYQKHR